MGKMLNFDQFLNEKNKEYIDVTIYGDVYKVPMETPAIVPIMMSRAEESIDPHEATKMIMRAADAMLGEESVNKLCRKGMSANALADLVQKLFSEINGDVETDDEAEEYSDEDSRKARKTDKKAKK